MSSTALLIANIRLNFISSVSIIFIVFGTVGNVLNIILFRKRALWTLSPCVPYLFAASISNMFNICAFLPFRTMTGFQFNPGYTSPVVCKLQIYFYYISFGISTWLMVACCADRFFSSSRNARIRRFSSMRLNTRMALVIAFIICFGYLQILYCYDAYQPAYRPSPCYVQDNFCNVVDVVYYIVVQTVGPPILMIIFGIGTFFHIRQTRQILSTLPVRMELVGRTATSTINTENTARNGDKNILPMLIMQVIVYLLCSIPLLSTKIYQNIPQPINKSDVRFIAEAFFLSMSILLSLVDKIFSFYIYTLSSKYYRKELIKLLLQCRPLRRIAAQQ